MRDGFIKAAVATPDIRVADIKFNTESILRLIEAAQDERAKIAVFPELCITGCTCGDLFFQEVLLKGARAALGKIADFSIDKDMLIFVGLPLALSGRIYDAAAALCRGKVLGFTTKSGFAGTDGTGNEIRFADGPEKAHTILYEGKELPFGPGIIFRDAAMDGLCVSAEIGEDFLSPKPPCAAAAVHGAVITVNCAAFPEAAGSCLCLDEQVKARSAQLVSGYVLANAGEGESSGDLMFAGDGIIAENGEILKKSAKFKNEIVYSEIDIQRLLYERRKNHMFRKNEALAPEVAFYLENEETHLTRKFAACPFVPEDPEKLNETCQKALAIQSYGLKKRMEHIGAEKAVLGISGGLDSTLALLVTARAFDLLCLDRRGIIAVTMPCFGTTGRTYRNARKMALEAGASLKDINIADTVENHLTDIGHDPADFNVTFENAQARERTQILMDIANEVRGIVVGTSDMSELAIGWTTYSGDHMSMYDVNVSVPKTLVPHLLRYEADNMTSRAFADILYDVLGTPASPELLPPLGGIPRKTEDVVGPYELHDFFLYYMLDRGCPQSKIFRLAKESFAGKYDEETVLKWLEVFTERFFRAQFKRSCLPDGPTVTKMSLSPRCGFKMPADSCGALWLQDLGK